MVKKQQLANLVMVVLIAVIALGGVLGVGHIQGWFEQDDGTRAVLGEVFGVTDLEREGVSYPAESGTVLRAGDKLTCEPGATAVIRMGESRLTLGERAVVTVSDPLAESFAAETTAGEIFVNSHAPLTLSLAGREVVFEETTALVSVRSGAQSISVFRGTAEGAAAGEIWELVGETAAVSALDIHSLNDFAIAQLRLANKTQTLCFTGEDLDALAEERRQAMQEMLGSRPEDETSSAVSETESTASSETESDVSSETSGEENSSAESTVSSDAPTAAPTPTPKATPVATPTPTAAPTATPVPTAEPTPTSAPTPTPTPAPTPSPTPVLSGGTVTIALYCGDILSNMEALDPAKAGFVPADGYILYPVEVSFEDGESVFDVLQRTCSRMGIALEYSWTPVYDSYYIEGINNLYEFDCGDGSGWVYEVNGWSPNYGCSSYILEDGDTVWWSYSCG